MVPILGNREAHMYLEVPVGCLFKVHLEVRDALYIILYMCLELTAGGDFKV